MSDNITSITKLQRVAPICSSEQLCRNTHCTSCARLFAMQKQELESTETMRKPHTELVAYNQEHDPLINMPPELVSLIFHFAVDYRNSAMDGVLGFFMESARTYKRPIWLGSVCTRWRQIALADPSLWSLIHIVDRTADFSLSGKSWAPSIELVREWLSRSGSLPLRIVLVWRQAQSSEDETLRRIIEALCNQCHRWRSLYVRIPAEALGYFKYAASEYAIDLDHLCIDRHGIGYHPWSMGLTTLRPRHVELHNLPWINGTLWWSNVVTLKISVARPDEALHIIMHASQLEELQIFIILRESAIEVAAVDAPVFAACLRRMRVAVMHQEDLLDFFMSIRAPELETLNLNGFGDPFIYVPMDLLLHSEKKLCELSISGLTFSTDDLLNLLSGLNNLSRLEIAFRGSQDEWVPSLDPLVNRLTQTSTEDPVTFLPRLSQLSYTGPRTLTWSVLVDAIYAHIAVAHNSSKRLLRSLNLELEPSVVPENYIDKDTLIRLLALKPSEMEMKVYIDRDLIQTSFEHHGINDAPYPLLFYPMPLLVDSR